MLCLSVISEAPWHKIETQSSDLIITHETLWREANLKHLTVRVMPKVRHTSFTGEKGLGKNYGCIIIKSAYLKSYLWRHREVKVMHLWHVSYMRAELQALSNCPALRSILCCASDPGLYPSCLSFVLFFSALLHTDGWSRLCCMLQKCSVCVKSCSWYGVVSTLLGGEASPLCAQGRYESWEEVWELQRRVLSDSSDVMLVPLVFICALVIMYVNALKQCTCIMLSSLCFSVLTKWRKHFRDM